MADLFHSIANQKRKVGVIPPKKFITRLRKENGERKVMGDKKLQQSVVIITLTTVLKFLILWFLLVDCC